MPVCERERLPCIASSAPFSTEACLVRASCVLLDSYLGLVSTESLRFGHDRECSEKSHWDRDDASFELSRSSARASRLVYDALCQSSQGNYVFQIDILSCCADRRAAAQRGSARRSAPRTEGWFSRALGGLVSRHAGGRSYRALRSCLERFFRFSRRCERLFRSARLSQLRAGRDPARVRAPRPRSPLEKKRARISTPPTPP